MTYSPRTPKPRIRHSRSSLNTSELIAAIDAEISRLQQARKTPRWRHRDTRREARRYECRGESANQRCSEEERGATEEGREAIADVWPHQRRSDKQKIAEAFA